MSLKLVMNMIFNKKMNREEMLDWKKANYIRLRERKEKSNSKVSCEEYDEDNEGFG